MRKYNNLLILFFFASKFSKLSSNKHQMATLDQQLQQHAHPKSHLNLVKDMHPMSRNIDCEVLVLQKGMLEKRLSS